jgi:hypothetical protein
VTQKRKGEHQKEEDKEELAQVTRYLVFSFEFSSVSSSTRNKQLKIEEQFSDEGSKEKKKKKIRY